MSSSNRDTFPLAYDNLTNPERLREEYSNTCQYANGEPSFYDSVQFLDQSRIGLQTNTTRASQLLEYANATIAAAKKKPLSAEDGEYIEKCLESSQEYTRCALAYLKGEIANPTTSAGEKMRGVLGIEASLASIPAVEGSRANPVEID